MCCCPIILDPSPFPLHFLLTRNRTPGRDKGNDLNPLDTTLDMFIMEVAMLFFSVTSAWRCGYHKLYT